MQPSRRSLLAAGGAAGLAAAAPQAASAKTPPTFDEAWYQAVLERYAAFGDKASGGPGDTASGAWLEGELTAHGYACERQTFDAPFFDVREASVSTGAAKAAVIPQAVVTPTAPGGLTAPLRLADAPDLAGAIALAVLPFRRWSSSLDPQAARALTDALQRGAAGVVLVTTGPTGEAVALNAPAKRRFDRPVAVLAPKDADPFVAAARAGASATLVLDGQGGMRPAYNLIGRLDRKAPKTLVLSTPRSGWFTCGGERGSGLAAWLANAIWAARSARGVNIELVCTSGHEYEYLGGEHYLAHNPAPPARTALWAHFGANVATRDWQEFGPLLQPLPSADTLRILMGSPALVPGLRRAFAGLPGLEAPYAATAGGSAGELTNILKAGYDPAFGVFGPHRYHHTRADDMRCTSGALVRPAAEAFRTAIAGYLASASR